jgi:hypothetical protein
VLEHVRNLKEQLLRLAASHGALRIRARSFVSRSDDCYRRRDRTAGVGFWLRTWRLWIRIPPLHARLKAWSIKWVHLSVQGRKYLIAVYILTSDSTDC